jgi:hypothetical protein
MKCTGGGMVRAPNPDKTGGVVMCLNCACGEVETKHKPTDITLSELKAAAKGHDMEVEQAADNIHNSARELKQAGKIS